MVLGEASSSDDDEPCFSNTALKRAAKKAGPKQQLKGAHQTLPAAPKSSRLSKVPRMMFPNVVNFTAFRSELDALVGDSYTIKALNSGDCAVQCNSPDSYRLVARHFLDKGSLFHHHQLPEDRPYKIVMRNIHHGVPSEDIIATLQNEGHNVVRIYTPRNKVTSLPLNMRFIDLKKAENNNQIKGISVVCRHRVIWEKPRKQSEPIQCHRCQGYGHTKAYCSRHYI